MSQNTFLSWTSFCTQRWKTKKKKLLSWSRSLNEFQPPLGPPILSLEREQRWVHCCRITGFCVCLMLLCAQSCLLCDPVNYIARQACLSMEFSRQEYWSGLPCPPLEHLPDPATELPSPALAGGFFTLVPPFTLGFEWVKSLSRVRLFATPWTVAPQAPPSMGFSRQEYWSGLPFPSPTLGFGDR